VVLKPPVLFEDLSESNKKHLSELADLLTIEELKGLSPSQRAQLAVLVKKISRAREKVPRYLYITALLKFNEVMV
jgi:hypothetical protein